MQTTADNTWAQKNNSRNRRDVLVGCNEHICTLMEIETADVRGAPVLSA